MLNAWSVHFLETKAGPDDGLATTVIWLPIAARLFVGSAVFSIFPYPSWEVLLGKPRAGAAFYAASGLAFHVLFPLSAACILRSLAPDVIVKRVPLVLNVAAIWALIALWYGGTPARFRSQVIVILFPFAAFGLRHVRQYLRLLVS